MDEQERTLRDVLRWDGLVALAPMLVSTLERNQLLRWILTMALRVVDAEACTLALNNTTTRELDYAVVLGEKEDAVRRFPVRSGEGILGWVAHHGKPVFARDVSKHPLWNRDVAAKIGFQTHSIVCVPLEIKGQATGALEVLNKRGGGEFTDEDLEILTAFASVAAVCVENARLYEWLSHRTDSAEADLLALNRELGRRNAEIDAVLSTMSDGLILLGAEGQVTEFNRAAEGLLGIRRPEALGTDSRAEPLAASPLGEVLAAIAGNPAEIGGREWSLPLPDGRTAICRVSPVADDAGTHLGLALVLNDVTTLTEVSRQKSEFVSYVSHELKTPLAVIRGFADALLPPSGDTTSPAERQEFLEIIRSQTDRTIRLITNLLNVARIEAGRALDLSPAPLDLAQLAEQTIEQTQRISPRHTLRLDAPAELAPVDADPDQIGQVFLNLLSNAVKYSPDGGEVLVSVEQTEEGVHVAVRDEGMGMTTEQISRLFRRFQRVLSDPSVAAGTGLGLYLSKGIVEAHGGRIWVESALGAGSTFHFVLPR